MVDRRTLVLMATGIGTAMTIVIFWFMMVDAYVQTLMDASISKFICRSGLIAGPVMPEVV